MTIPTLLKDMEPSEELWKRRARDLINQTAQRVMGVGLTAERPRNPVTGSMYYDATLHKPCWWSGTNWRDASGTVV